jgi:hypothetical protein
LPPSHIYILFFLAFASAPLCHYIRFVLDNYTTGRRTFNIFAKMKPTAAQLERMMGGGPQAIVAIHPSTAEDISPVIVGQEMLKLQGDDWQPLPFASKLGMGQAIKEYEKLTPQAFRAQDRIFVPHLNTRR